MLKCAIIKIDRGKDVKKHCLIKNGYFAPYPFTSAETGVDVAEAR